MRGTPADIALLRLHAGDESVRHIYAATLSGRTLSPSGERFLTDTVRKVALDYLI